MGCSIGFTGAGLALASAALFGASTPRAKALLGNVAPWMLAGLLYLAAGLGLGAIHFSRRALGIEPPEAPLRRIGLPWLAAVVAAGGITGPVLLMIGLTKTDASSASVLLNLEGLFTLGIAWVVFRESIDLCVASGAAAILSGAVLLSWSGGVGGFGWGSLAITGACLAWGIDNNLTRGLSSGTPPRTRGTGRSPPVLTLSIRIVMAKLRHCAWFPRSAM